VEVPTIHVCGLAAYDGTDYFGFQAQADVPTIQGELEKALAKFSEPVGRVAGAGRTDAGVHASGQVIAVRTKWRHDPAQLQRAWNAHLPRSICVRAIELAPEWFHPRFSAEKRTYRYRVVMGGGQDSGDAPDRSPLTDRFAWYEPAPLALEQMQEAGEHLVGEHDFASFGQPTQGESTVRRVMEVRWQEEHCSPEVLDRYPGRRLTLTITANGFLRRMVRSIVGTLLEVGRGRRRPDEVKELLAAKDRGLAAPPAPACGLTLERVVYPRELNVFVAGDV
jgi:tRNA pseudouridine38-40 synthase